MVRWHLSLNIQCPNAHFTSYMRVVYTARNKMYFLHEEIIYYARFKLYKHRTQHALIHWSGEEHKILANAHECLDMK